MLVNSFSTRETIRVFWYFDSFKDIDFNQGSPSCVDHVQHFSFTSCRIQESYFEFSRFSSNRESQQLVCREKARKKNF